MVIVGRLLAVLQDLTHLTRRLQTVEPGIFVPPHASFPKGFHNLNVRVEDEVLVREDDYVLLSVAPKEVVDIEAACQGLFDGVK
jgi:intermediate cleaving peptidase 55